MRTVWLQPWFSTRRVPAPGGASEIRGGGFDGHMAEDALLDFGGQRPKMLAVLQRTG